MRWILNCCYLLAIAVAAPWLVWQAFKHGKYRDGWRAKLLGHVPRPSDPRPVVWLHAVSVGEVKLAIKVQHALQQRLPQHQFLVSATSRTGYELARREFPDSLVTYAPLDFSWAVRRALRELRPVAVVLIELELWPNLILAASQLKPRIPVFIVNGRLSASSYRGYVSLRQIVRRAMSRVTWVGAQNQEYADRFLKLGATCCEITGSIKFDQLDTDRANPATSERVALSRIRPTDLVFLAGSTQPIENDLVVRVFQRLAPQFPDLRLVLVPRHPEHFQQAAQLLDATGMTWVRRSQLPEPHDRAWQALLVDTVGELSAWWGRADIAFVGGSLCDRGGQNMIEPAAYGAAVCFGPNTVNFRDVAEPLVAQKGAVVVSDAHALEAFVSRCASDSAYRHRLGTTASAWVQSQAGALDRTAEVLATHLGETSRSRDAA